MIRGADDADRTLVDLLARDEFTAGELSSLLALDGEAVRSKLAALDAFGALVPGSTSAALEPQDAERFSRQLVYLAEFGDERDLQRRLMDARIAVLGCGGLGTWAIAALAAAGVRRFRLGDDDSVELSNLNRQAIFRHDDVGRPKVEAAAQWLQGFDPRSEVECLPVRVDGPAAARRMIGDADALVFTADHPPYELARWVNEACVDGGVPFIGAGQLPPLIRVGPLYRPGETACFACHETALRARSIAYDRYVERARSAPVRAATLGPASAMVGSLLAMELLHLIVGVEPATTATAFTVDLRTLAVRRDTIPRDDRCPACRPS